MRVRLIAFDLEVLERIGVDARRAALDAEAGEGVRLTRDLEPRLFDVVGVEMRVAAGPDELAGLEPALVGDHVRQERVARDVERKAKKGVAASLVELEREPAVRDMRLEQAMAGGEGHTIELARVPRGDDLAA